MKTSEEQNKMSRRKFMTWIGGAAGVATLASMGISTHWEENKVQIDVNTIPLQQKETDVLVIGGGMAGLFAAVKAHDAGAQVMMVSKGRLGSSGQTPFAKGMFVYDPEKEQSSLDDFVSAVSRSAINSNNATYTRQMAEHSLDRINELKEWGFFESPIYHKAFSKPIADRNIPVIERVVITHLIKENGRIAGAAGFSLDEENIQVYKAKSVILCTGAGGFKPNGFPICDLTHDGTAMAYRIGAKVTGKEWNDGHPGQANNAADCYNGWHGMFDRKPGLTSVEIHHDLGVDLNYIAYKEGGPVAMGPPGKGGSSKVTGGPFVPPEFKRSGPPEEPNREEGEGGRKRPDKRPPREGGAPPGMAGINTGGSSAGMSIHKSEGLVPINDQCESTIPGLYAAGDALGSYMAGAIYTQVGSSLTGSAVQGAIAAEAATKYCQVTERNDLAQSKLDQIQEEILAPLKKTSGYSPAWVTQTLQGIMIPNFILYIKKENLMKAALAYIEELRDHHLPMLKAADLHELRLAHETANMILTAEMKLKASLLRKESRLSHFRLDYPELDNENWQAWINIFQGKEGEMQFEKQAFGTWPV